LIEDLTSTLDQVYVAVGYWVERTGIDGDDVFQGTPSAIFDERNFMC
jgi:hypothetical protein